MACVDLELDELMYFMTLEEKVGQLCQVDGRIDAENWVLQKGVGSFLHVTGDEAIRLQKLAEETRLGIPILFGIDAIHGHAFQSGAVVFPSQLAMASMWDLEFVEQMAKATAKEVSACGLHWTFSPVLCLGRDVRWGRTDETFGEDPFLAGKLAAAMIRGYQGIHPSGDGRILACAKHYIAYGETLGARDSTDAPISDRQLRSVFLPPFEEAIKAGVSTIMAGYHSVDGTPCSANSYLLKDILRDELDFCGVVVSDWDNTGHLIHTQKVAEDYAHATQIMLASGNDMIMATPKFYETAIELVKAGTIPEDWIDSACRRILELKYNLGLFQQKRYPKVGDFEKIVGCEEHIELAYQAAMASMILLKNENEVLPITKKTRRIAVIGPNSDDVQAQLGDWSFGPREFSARPTLDYHPEYDVSRIVTLIKGIRKRAGNDYEIVYLKGCDRGEWHQHRIEEAWALASTCDLIIVCVGDDNTQNGELLDRTDLNLSEAQQILLKKLKSTCVPMVTILLCGKPLTIPWLAEHSDALICTFNPGEQGGRALASLLFGDASPSGKLPISFPRHIGQLPVYYNQVRGGHSTQYVDCPLEPQWPFGFGMSYTQFTYGPASVSCSLLQEDTPIIVEVEVWNQGKFKASEIIQVYLTDVVSSVATSELNLKGFDKLTLKPGESGIARIELSLDAFKLLDQKGRWVLEKGLFIISVGSSSRKEDLQQLLIEYK